MHMPFLNHAMFVKAVGTYQEKWDATKQYSWSRIVWRLRHKFYGAFPTFLPQPVYPRYVSKWMEAMALPTNDAKVGVKFLKKNIFTRLARPRAIISGGGRHVCNRQFDSLHNKYGVKHRVATPYHAQTSGQVEVSNKELKRILKKIVSQSRKDWAISMMHYGYIVQLTRHR